MTAATRRTRSTEAFFGRRHGKSLRPAPLAALESGLPRYRLDLAPPPPEALPSLFPVAVDTVRLEIGFGAGEHLRHEAGRFPRTGFIGVEPFVNGLAKLMLSLEREPLSNLRVYDDDATRLLDWLPDASISGIDLFYPDPWPKKRHWKRRFVSPVNLARFARVLAPGGLFRFASDIDSYVDWTLLHVGKCRHFEWLANRSRDWQEPFDGWPGTRYEAKALKEGRRPAYLSFRRR
ncbi:MAG: tRNA (guanosine(46)-N7)-methyltransferase TrmB [Rhizobiaceae bacterium]|nr:MAG: tRNA (guanosine(46)-N7)-methyltransferase TrmB [Rhizobiaceae bacterium]